MAPAPSVAGSQMASPVITPVSYVFSITNDAPNRVGWRYYSVSDINSQLGSLGWLLLLSNAPAGSEIAIRRMPFPASGIIGTRMTAMISPPPDMWILELHQCLTTTPKSGGHLVYRRVSSTQALGNFVLSGQELPVPVSTDRLFRRCRKQRNPDQSSGWVWQYFEVVVPADTNLLGWDLRLTNVTAGVRKCWSAGTSCRRHRAALCFHHLAERHQRRGGLDGCGGGPCWRWGWAIVEPGT